MMDDRLTRCPHCLTPFTVTESDLQQAFGAARCGSCKKIFNAANHLFELEQEDIQLEVSGSHSTADSFFTDIVNEESPTSLQAHSSAPDKAIPDKSMAKPQSSEAQPESVETLQHEGSAADLLKQLSDAPEISLESDDLSEIRKARQAAGTRQHQLEIALTAAREDDAPELTDYLHFSAETEVKPREALETSTRAPKGLPAIPWIPVSVTLGTTALLFILIWSSTKSFSESPSLSGIAEATCNIKHCEHLLPSDFDRLQASQIALIEQSSQLTAELVLNNPGQIPLPFPAILLELRGIDGKVVQEALYQPSQYLKGKPFADHILPPELPVALSFSTDGPLQGVENLSVKYFPASHD